MFSFIKDIFNKDLNMKTVAGIDLGTQSMKVVITTMKRKKSLKPPVAQWN